MLLVQIYLDKKLMKELYYKNEDLGNTIRHG